MQTQHLDVYYDVIKFSSRYRRGFDVTNVKFVSLVFVDRFERGFLHWVDNNILNGTIRFI